LRHGETGNVLMPVLLKNAIIIPQKATFEILDKKYVYVLDDKNVLHAKQITVGTELPHLYVVTGGITTKDKILMEGLGKVKDNDKIESEFVPIEKVFSDINNLHAE
jgi:membrane fusion protein (multidrug efflux system)